MSATIAALVIAKVVVITDHFAAVNRFPDKPLIYNVVWKTVIYFVAWLLMRYLEHVIHFLARDGELRGGEPPVVGGDRLAAFLGRAALDVRSVAGLLRLPRNGARGGAGADHRHLLSRSRETR
ncbi:MAG: hypothetical protein M3463_20990 [Verrucomicrobiota bacterium]|nr:hypothetical protein [Verrucomicrobiota bacterium]